MKFALLVSVITTSFLFAPKSSFASCECYCSAKDSKVYFGKAADLKACTNLFEKREDAMDTDCLPNSVVSCENESK